MELTKAIRLDSKYALAYNNRGLAYYYKGDYDRAIADFNQVLQLDPNNADAYNNRDNAYRKSNLFLKTNNVIALARQGWKKEEIAKAMKLSLGEIELILEKASRG